MTKLTLDITTSLDGFVAGPNASLERPLGEGGERLHEWAVSLAPFRERHGLEGGKHNVDADVVQENLDATGAVVMGRRMLSGGEGPRADDPNADGWWVRRAAVPRAPLLLGNGVHLFDRLGIDPIVELETARVIASPSVTHLRFRVLR